MATASSSQCRNTARRLEAITPADKLRRDEDGCAIRGVDEPGEGRVRESWYISNRLYRGDCGWISLNVRVWVTSRTIKTVRFGARRY
jgi:hypothetical protein